jgi:GAF domain-containing protein
MIAICPNASYFTRILIKGTAMEISTGHPWRDVLQRSIKAPDERQRLATALGLTTTTLIRWASGETTPQDQQLARLVKAIHPKMREELIEALQHDYPAIRSSLEEETIESISPEFFAELLSVRATTPTSQRFWRVSDLVLSQILRQLDPNGLGMSITLVQCMPPTAEHHDKVYSLREVAGKGSLPWAAELEHLALFLGAESLGGYVTETGLPHSIDNLAYENLTPAYQSEFEISAAAHPVMFGGRIAGCLSVSSTSVAYFSPERMALLATFSDLVALAFEKHEFYPQEMIELKVMPAPAIQRPILASFQQRVAQAHIAAARQHQRITIQEAQRQVWRDIEDEFVSLTLPL